MDNLTLKKHKNQMNRSDFMYIRSKVRNATKQVRWGLQIRLTNHAKEKIQFGNADGVTYDDIINTLYDFDIIEYKLTLKDKNVGDKIYKDEVLSERVVLRSGFEKDGYNIVIVYSLFDNSIITIWKNKIDDTHKTVNLKPYTLKQVGFM